MIVQGRGRTRRRNGHILWGSCREVVQCVADPWHTRHLHFPRCSLSWCRAPPVPLLSSRHCFVCPHNLPAKEATQVVPISVKAHLPLHPLSYFFPQLSASSCVCWLPASSRSSAPGVATQRDTSLAEINLFQRCRVGKPTLPHLFFPFISDSLAPRESWAALGFKHH